MTAIRAHTLQSRAFAKRAQLVFAPLCASVVLSACPVSYPRTGTASPPIVGRLVSDSGTPIANATLAVPIDWDDRTCRKAVRRVMTDTAGNFAIRASEKHLTTMWIVPLPFAPRSPRTEFDPL